jgi:hypothetical protein
MTEFTPWSGLLGGMLIDPDAVAKVVDDLYNRHITSLEKVGGVSCDDFKRMNKSLHRLERFWTDQILYRL